MRLAAKTGCTPSWAAANLFRTADGLAFGGMGGNYVKLLTDPYYFGVLP